ncbi:MAG: 2-dehydro-3-deoxy-phosphogluconate aldolase [Beduini sp.]|uniref:2-dehydro-3-deoxy-phosphogluconate aldolase n=1 Tax=Beduini sp. TaxID=1922300 RepID=UPI0039A38C58
MKKTPNYLNDKICLNVLTGSLENAKELYEATRGHILLGLLSKNYPTNEEAIEDMLKYAAIVDNCISVGLGAGDPNQSKMVSEISRYIQPRHVNQVFTGVAATRALLGQNETVVNGLISPTGTVGMVKVSTGPLSSTGKDAIIPVDTAILMLKDMGCSSVKFFPMKGLATRDEFVEVCQACARNDFMLEPTGGIDLDNFEEICRIALDNGVKKVIPHVYSSIIDSETKLTRIEDVKVLYDIMQKLTK